MEYLIINGAECEPLLRTDRYIMKHLGERVVSAAEAVTGAAWRRTVPDRFEKTYTEEIKALEKVLKAKNSRVELAKWTAFIRRGTSRPWFMKSQDGWFLRQEYRWMWAALFPNVATMLGISDAMEGKPFTKNI